MLTDKIVILQNPWPCKLSKYRRELGGQESVSVLTKYSYSFGACGGGCMSGN